METDLSKSLNLNTIGEKPLFEPTFLNLEYLFNKIFDFFRSIFGFSDLKVGVGGETVQRVSESSSPFSSIFYITLFSLATFFIFIITYCFIRILEIRKKENEHLQHEIAEYAKIQAAKEEQGIKGNFRNERWENVLNYLSSPNQSDWKLAIMEADSMLEELMDELEFDGGNLGEKLKGVNKEKFKSLDDAWEAHLVRNKIAHEGSRFEISQHEVNRIITLYENVFREFGYI